MSLQLAAIFPVSPIFGRLRHVTGGTHGAKFPGHDTTAAPDRIKGPRTKIHAAHRARFRRTLRLPCDPRAYGWPHHPGE
ncbi:hypothetical protein GCM10022251_47650 [Phytohabitans flavus]